MLSVVQVPIVQAPLSHGWSRPPADTQQPVIRPDAKQAGALELGKRTFPGLQPPVGGGSCGWPLSPAVKQQLDGLPQRMLL